MTLLLLRYFSLVSSSFMVIAASLRIVTASVFPMPTLCGHYLIVFPILIMQTPLHIYAPLSDYARCSREAIACLPFVSLVR
jgi:hypothetical protein